MLSVLVALAMAEVYHRSRQQAINQTRTRQALLASATASGIEQYYKSIFADLDLFKRAEEDQTEVAAKPAISPATAQRFASRTGPVRFGRLLWRQLESRASYLLVVDRANPIPTRFFPDEMRDRDEVPAERGAREKLHAEHLAELTRILEPAKPWLRTVDKPTIGPFQHLDGMDFNLIAIPVGGDAVLLAVVPAKTIQLKFIDPLNEPRAVGAWLLDDNGQVVSSFIEPGQDQSMRHRFNAAQMRAMSAEPRQPGQAGWRVIEQKTTMAGVTVWPSIVNVRPAEVGGKQWWVVIASPLSETDHVVQQMFGRALLWAVFVVISMTAILVSTAVQLIRGRSRLRQIEHELLQREVKDARQIQLAWLPSEDHPSDCINVAAINKTANQISGDFYNWFDLPDGRTAIVIGDVTGHGMAAAFLMATTQLLMRTTLQRLGDLSKTLEEVNRQLCSIAYSGQFVTMLLMVIDLPNGYVDIASAGHAPPLIGADNHYEPLSLQPHYVLGVEPDEQYQTLRIKISALTRFVFYTDGVLDAQNASGDRFGLPRLRRSLATPPTAPRQTIDAILAAVDKFSSGHELHDDLTLLVVELKPVPTAAQSDIDQPGQLREPQTQGISPING